MFPCISRIPSPCQLFFFFCVKLQHFLCAVHYGKIVSVGSMLLQLSVGSLVVVTLIITRQSSWTFQINYIDAKQSDQLRCKYTRLTTRNNLNDKCKVVLPSVKHLIWWDYNRWRRNEKFNMNPHHVLVTIFPFRAFQQSRLPSIF